MGIGRRSTDAFLSMTPSSVLSQTSITQIGTIARECLTPGCRGKVLAVVSKAIYLLTEERELFWITTKDVPMHRRCAQITSALPQLFVGSLFRVDNHRLITDSGFISLGN